MATDWSARTEAIIYFDKLVRELKRAHDDETEIYDAALSALRRSKDHTALQSKLNAAMKIIRTIAENPDCAHASCGQACRDFIGSAPSEEGKHEV
jgi:hypothetical protein